MENRQIRVVQQLIHTSDGENYVEVPKTKTSVRIVPLTDVAYEAFDRVLAQRATQTCTKEIDGQTDFVFLNRHGAPLTAKVFRVELSRIV